MAVKWAVANGNWSAGATWNDGVVPTSGDYVYLNGKTLSHTTNINIGIGTITNASNVDLSIVAGGILNINANNSNDLTITANLIQSGSAPLLYLNRQAHSNLTKFIGDIENDQTYAVDILENNNKISVIGNLTISNVGLFYTHNPYSNVTELFTITGTVNGSGKLLADNSCNIANLSIVGNAKYDIGNSLVGNLQKLSVTGIFAMQSNITIPTIEVDGVYRVDNNSLTTCTTFTINGGIEYTSANNNIGVKYTTLNIIDNTTFTWKDISEPRLNPFIIVTNADMNNRQQYPPEDEVKQGTEYVWGEKVGTYTPDYPQEAEVLQGVIYDNGNKTGTLSPVILGDYPAEADVKVGVVFDYGNKVGTFQPMADYPAEADVLQGVEYAYGQMTGTLSVATDYPQEANVLQGVEYADGSMVGTLEVVQLQADYPSEDDVRFDVPFDFGNKQGKCHVPIPEDVRDGVPVDVNEVGTLIPSSGGDRLRIADFGYYTNAQSDTYIVDLTEQDKPKFAVAEERVLIEMFPNLDLDNIPDKYFDDLFVKYLKYRLIVEYYRTAGINSTFTPSEPTTEIVNYQNVRNEVWLNSANIYLKAWGKKYPESITKPQRILL